MTKHRKQARRKQGGHKVTAILTYSKSKQVDRRLMAINNAENSMNYAVLLFAIFGLLDDSVVDIGTRMSLKTSGDQTVGKAVNWTDDDFCAFSVCFLRILIEMS
ncbi:hypothetical protein PAXRUDRAFT_271392 [Paxillus rubicundulus Ve08.2h10]|uniref:Uncharacterized protein n=1 Tax=Paxillus rubicundulus Ve08.2h10 TaxID=930991 RepID=A0A0D0DN97_9AGAM|nr:hypothetical protein PAXRUDRAFT_271392 [Paxillus rubicundulus Ve08.2h10]